MTSPAESGIFARLPRHRRHAIPPFFSIVIPTRARRELLAQVLRSLAQQTFPDFEAIVCDDPLDASARPLLESMADPRFRYVAPGGPLPLYENWEAGCAAATGEWRMLLTDKTVLRPSALRLFHAAVAATGDAEIVSSTIETCLADGRYFPTLHAPQGPRPFDPRVELRRKLRFEVPHAADPRNFFLGNPCSSAWRASLVARLKAAHGRLFFPVSADFGAMAAALAEARAAIDLGEPVYVGVVPADSVGHRMSRFPSFTRSYLADLGRACGRDFLAELPLPGLYSSLTNVIAGDYRNRLEAAGRAGERVDLEGLRERAREDLERAEWESQAERREQWETWRRCGGRRAGSTLRARFAAGASRWKARVRARCRGPVLGRLWSALATVRRALSPAVANSAPPLPIDCVDLLDAAQGAEVHYGGRPNAAAAAATVDRPAREPERVSVRAER